MVSKDLSSRSVTSTSVVIRPDELYICGCGGSDYVSGDRLRSGGDCESADKIHEDPRRVAAARRSFEAMTAFPSQGQQKPVPTVVQARSSMYNSMIG